MKNLTLPKILEQVGKMTAKRREAYGQYQLLKEQEDGWRNRLIEELQKIGLRSAKTADFTASMVSKPNISIQHEQSVIDWLKNAPNIETDQYIGLKKTEFKSLAMNLLKDTGEVVPGTELVNTEYLSIKANKGKK